MKSMKNMKRSMAISCLVIFWMLAVQSCKSQKETAKELPREEKIQTMEVKKVESKKVSIDQEKLNNLVLEQTKRELFGTWQWHRTDCCARLPNTTYAKDTDKPKSLYFSKNNTLTYFENGKETSTVPFEVGRAFNDDRVTLKSGEFKTAIMHLKGDTLVLDYGYMDLAVDYYIKESSK